VFVVVVPEINERVPSAALTTYTKLFSGSRVGSSGPLPTTAVPETAGPAPPEITKTEPEESDPEYSLAT
jgi:hypothetical protein